MSATDALAWAAAGLVAVTALCLTAVAWGFLCAARHDPGDAAADEAIDRLLASRREPIDPRDVDLWGRQILAADTAEVMADIEALSRRDTP